MRKGGKNWIKKTKWGFEEYNNLKDSYAEDDIRLFSDCLGQQEAMVLNYSRF